MRALCAAAIVLSLVCASCDSQGRPFFQSLATLDSNADAVYDGTLCEAAFAMGALLSDPDPEQNVTGSFAVFDPVNERLRIVAYGQGVDGTQALVLVLQGGGDFVDDSGDPEIVESELGTINAGTLTMFWGRAANASSGGVPLLPDITSFGEPAALAIDLTLTDTGFTLLRGTSVPLYELGGTLSIDDLDCTNLDGDDNAALDFDLEFTGILAYEGELDPAL